MAVLYTPHFVQFFDNNGDPLSGGLLYTYAAGTTTPKATFTTAAGGVQNANPVVLDSSGRATLFIDGAYKFRLETSAGVLVRETDNVDSFEVASAVSTAVNWNTADTLASAATVNIGAATSNYVIITGTTTITSFGTIAQGAERILRFAGSLQITHNATSMILPGGANITTQAGDIARFISEGSGNWRLIGFESANLELTAASASTVNLDAFDVPLINVTGTTTITSFGTSASGTMRRLVFQGILTLTHNATSLILPGGANIITAVGDSCLAVSLGSGNWRVVDYQSILGSSSVNAQTFTASGTWTKPAAGTVALIQCWGGGGGGSGTGGSWGGGGGGAYAERLMRLSDLGATVTVTIAAGGTGGATGTNGGNTTFGTHVTAFGGAGSTAAVSGGGGGEYTAGSGSTAGDFGGGAGNNTGAGQRARSSYGGGSGGWTATAGGGAIYGGGGGGGGVTGPSVGAGGVSFYGGNGGGSTVNNPGVAPAGGGGAGGNGARGECRVTVW